ncbi:3-hydroxyisobutyrate dehydrogenase [Dactylosporangium matsuzakiense]|uniref:3-hydroxyisobutyrate dehydrogenase n=2 Tax=Dactylosporangium matsuzakiense TaxID=53360 RepID=A0A9W6KJP9_9ACTN|nr:3-hydroxyisobutyrate dehydrogenase [Dactylosporangium matsuzakiense]
MSHAPALPSVAGMQTVAVLGLGRMGAAIAGRLVDQGYAVRTWNRSPRPPVPGAVAAGSAAEACAGAGFVVTMLTDAAAVLAVVGAADLRAGATLIEMSTIGPDGVLKVAGALPAGVDMVDAPVGGSVGAAAGGALRILAGGDPAVLDRAETVLAALGSVHRCGALGRGAANKLVLNTAVLAGLAALADALAVGAALGIAREDALELLRASPLAAVVGRAMGGPGAAFGVALAAKDLDLARAAAAGVPLPAADGAAELLRRAVAAGPADADVAVLMHFHEVLS